MTAIHQDRNGCALHGALQLLGAIQGVVPIVHANAGCSLGASAPDRSAPQAGWLEISATQLQERHVVFGGTSRLREQIKNTVKVQDGDLYVVVTGCVPEIVGDDVPAMVKEAREQQYPVITIATPGFKGNAYSGYESALRVLIQQLPTLPALPDAAPTQGHINLLGIVPQQDLTWEGDLLELEASLEPLGLPIKRLFGFDQRVADWHALPHARLNIVLSPWGLEAAQLLRERYGTPYLYLGWVPVGRDLANLVEEVGTELDIPQAQHAALKTALNAKLRYFLHKTGAAYLLHDLQKRVAIVGSTAYATGLARFLAGTFGQIVSAVILTDAPPAALRQDIEASIRAVVTDASLPIHFEESREAIDAALRAAAPEIILGSALEAHTAQALQRPLLEIATPSQHGPALLRRHAGIAGAVDLVEAYSNALIAHARKTDAGRRLAQHAPTTEAEPALVAQRIARPS